MKIEWKTCLKIGISAFLLYLCIHYLDNFTAFIKTLFGAAFPLIIGAIIAYLINILMTFYERHYFPKSTKPAAVKTKRPVCMILAVISLVAVAALIISLVVPQLISCIELIIAELPPAINKVIAWINSLDILPDDIMSVVTTIDWKSKIGQIAEMLTSGIGSVMDVVITAVTSVISGVVTAIIAVIFAIYLLLCKDKLGNQFGRLMKNYSKPEWNEKIRYVISIIDDSFHRYIVGQCTEAVILGVLCTIGMLILRLPYAPMIGAFIAFTALIPIAGAYIGAAVGAFIILMESPVKALVFLVFIIILQQIEGNLIYPKVVGSSMGLPGIWVLAAITIGGGVMGITGILISVPVAATIYKLVRNDLINKEQTKISQEQDDTNG